jgi:hypothetical protein
MVDEGKRGAGGLRLEIIILVEDRYICIGNIYTRSLDNPLILVSSVFIFLPLSLSFTLSFPFADPTKHHNLCFFGRNITRDLHIITVLPTRLARASRTSVPY